MTISAPTFQRLQDGIQRVDDLRVRGPINAALAWLSGDLVTQLNTHFDAVSNSISSALATLLATANTWTAAQTVALTTTGAALTLRTSDSTAAEGPSLLCDRDSGSPAASDVIGAVVFRGRDSNGNAVDYARVRGVISDPTDGSEDGRFVVVCQVAGAATNIATWGAGLQVGTPTGGDQGLGTINMDNALYKDGTQVVSSRVTGYGDPFGAISRATISVTTVTTAALAQFVAAMYTDLKAHGLIGN